MKKPILPLLLGCLLLATPLTAHSVEPVIDVAHISVSAKNLATHIGHASTSAANAATNAMHKVQTTLGWMHDQIQQLLHTGLLGEVMAINQVMQLIQDEIMRAAGTVEDIINIPSVIMEDLFSIIGSVKDTIMDVAGVKDAFEETQAVFERISDLEAFGQYAVTRAKPYLDFGPYRSAYGALSTIRGIQTRTAIEQLRMVDDERKAVEKAINTFELSDNAAEIAKGNAQLTAAIHREIARQNEMAALDVQCRTAQAWANEARGNAWAGRALAAARALLLNADY